jgi:hypothetical protein
MEISKNRVHKEVETKTLYLNESHLKPVLLKKLKAGLIDPYNISFYNLHSHARGCINLWRSQGYKAVFKYEDKNVLILYNK